MTPDQYHAAFMAGYKAHHKEHTGTCKARNAKYGDACWWFNKLSDSQFSSSMHELDRERLAGIVGDTVSEVRLVAPFGTNVGWVEIYA